MPPLAGSWLRWTVCGMRQHSRARKALGAALVVAGVLIVVATFSGGAGLGRGVEALLRFDYAPLAIEIPTSAVDPASVYVVDGAGRRVWNELSSEGAASGHTQVVLPKLGADRYELHWRQQGDDRVLEFVVQVDWRTARSAVRPETCADTDVTSQRSLCLSRWAYTFSAKHGAKASLQELDRVLRSDWFPRGDCELAAYYMGEAIAAAHGPEEVFANSFTVCDGPWILYRAAAGHEAAYMDVGATAPAEVASLVGSCERLAPDGGKYCISIVSMIQGRLGYSDIDRAQTICAGNEVAPPQCLFGAYIAVAREVIDSMRTGLRFSKNGHTFKGSVDLWQYCLDAEPGFQSKVCWTGTAHNMGLTPEQYVSQVCAKQSTEARQACEEGVGYHLGKGRWFSADEMRRYCSIVSQNAVVGCFAQAVRSRILLHGGVEEELVRAVVPEELQDDVTAAIPAYAYMP